MATTSSAVRTKTPLWAKLLLFFLIVLLVAGAAVVGVTVGKFIGAKEERSVQVIRSITREQQIILVTAGLSDDIPRKGDALSVFGFFDLPGTERALNVRFDFDGKFGIDGKDVKIDATGENRYRITIPRFEYLGYDNPKFSVISEANGLLSWTTQEIDKLDVAESVLSEAAAATHIDGIRPVLEEGAKEFYTTIVTAIDPSITLEFEFTQ